MKKLEGRVAIVTGASSGVGRGLAKVLAENGAKICACARRVEKLEELKAEVEGFGGEVLPVACDVTDVEQINHVVVQCVERFGGIDILINCAQGAMQYREINDVDEAYTLEAFESGPLASMMFMKACFPYLLVCG
ncbi:MAG: SDR family NAD(P)-dependent oxidoreductase, partial [Coriobacteriaceae bacterium]